MKYYFLGVKYALKYYFSGLTGTCWWLFSETALCLVNYKKFLDDNFGYAGFSPRFRCWDSGMLLSSHKDFYLLNSNQLRRLRAKIIFKFITTYKEKAFKWDA